MSADLPNENNAASREAITLEDRLKHGNLTIFETCKLANRSHSGFYQDLKRGLVSIRKLGRKSVVPGPVAERYIQREEVV